MRSKQKNKRRCLVIAQYLNYGSGKGVASQIEQLILSGFEVHLILSRETKIHFHSKILVENLWQKAVRFHFVESTFLRNSWCAQSLAKKILDLFQNGDLILSHGGFSSYVLSKTSLSYYHICHGFGLNRPKWVEDQDFIGISNAKSVVAVSLDIRNQLLIRKIQNSKIHVIYYPIQLPDFHSHQARSIRHLAVVANLVELKGHRFAIDALSHLRFSKGMGQNLVLNFFGEGPLEGRLKTQVIESNLESQVIFHGFKSMMTQYKNIDLLLVPSMVEGLGLSIVEAFSYGIPVIAFDSGGIHEIVIHERTGILVERGNFEQMAIAIKSCVEDPHKFRKMSRAGLFHVRSLLSPENFQSWIRQISSS